MSTTWTTISKPSVTSWTNIPKAPSPDKTTTIIAGNPIGLLLALTYAAPSSFTTSLWTDIPKANGTVWTNIPKAT